MHLQLKFCPTLTWRVRPPKRTTEQLAGGTYVKAMVLFYYRLCAMSLKLNSSTITLPEPPNLSTNFLTPFPMEGSHELKFRYYKSNLIFWAPLLCRSQATFKFKRVLVCHDRRHTWAIALGTTLHTPIKL